MKAPLIGSTQGISMNNRYNKNVPGKSLIQEQAKKRRGQPVNQSDINSGQKSSRDVQRQSE